MKTKLRELLASGGLGGLSGMGLLGILLWVLGGDPIDTGADMLARSVCSAPVSERPGLIERANENSAPHTIRVTCADGITLETDDVDP